MRPPITMAMYWSQSTTLAPRQVSTVEVISEPSDLARRRMRSTITFSWLVCLHDAAEHHGADDDRDGVEHGGEAALAEQGVDRLDAGVAGIAAVGDLEQLGVGRALEDQAEHHGREHACHQARDRRRYFL